MTWWKWTMSGFLLLLVMSAAIRGAVSKDQDAIRQANARKYYPDRGVAPAERAAEAVGSATTAPTTVKQDPGSAVELARRTASNRESCDTPLLVKQAWEKLQCISPSDRQYRAAQKAAQGLERCRKAMMKSLSANMQKMLVANRVNWADEYETKLLKEGMDVRVRLAGARKERVTIQYALFGRAVVYQVTDGGSMAPGAILRILQDMGFRRVVFSDGFYESYSYDLQPDPLNFDAGATMELPTPLVLP